MDVGEILLHSRVVLLAAKLGAEVAERLSIPRHRRLLARLVDGGVLRLGDLTMDADAHVVSVSGKPLTLAAKEFALLEFLLRNAGRVLTHRQLLDHGATTPRR